VDAGDCGAAYWEKDDLGAVFLLFMRSLKEKQIPHPAQRPNGIRNDIFPVLDAFIMATGLFFEAHGA
jgi:hypothetical protein